MKSYPLKKTLVLCLLTGGMMISCTAEKLFPGQKPPPHATNSGGGLLKAPPVRAADVGSRPDVGRSGPPARPAQQDGVVREETDDIKEVDGQPVRVVKGSLAYDSPEGLGISVKYEADENGNRASFTIGNPGGGTGSRPKSNSGGSSGRPGRPPGGAGDGNKATTYLPPMNADKNYLPPS